MARNISAPLGLSRWQRAGSGLHRGQHLGSMFRGFDRLPDVLNRTVGIDETWNQLKSDVERAAQQGGAVPAVKAEVWRPV
jgi:hypothetical protein